MLARRFLGCIVVLTLLAVAAAFAFYQWGGQMLVQASGPDYGKAESWAARPGASSDRARWLPRGAVSTAPAGALAATFYVHPTTYLKTDRWNAPLDPGGEAGRSIDLFLQSQASVFSGAGEIWAPHYRQAAYGAFLLSSDDARKSLDLAYRDVRAAFDQFLAEVGPDRPLILAGHSQGSMHLLRLLAERRRELGGRIVAAYVGGWPVGLASDLPATGLPACARPGQSGCVLSWQSFAEPGNVQPVLGAWVATDGLTGRKRSRSDMACVNPLTGTIDGSAGPSANRGTLVPDKAMNAAELVPGRVGARCGDGFLWLDGDIPNLGPYVLPGNNYHVYDYALFWANLREDVSRRLEAWRRR
jgi:hypothetical protein